MAETPACRSRGPAGHSYDYLTEDAGRIADRGPSNGGAAARTSGQAGFQTFQTFPTRSGPGVSVT